LWFLSKHQIFIGYLNLQCNEYLFYFSILPGLHQKSKSKIAFYFEKNRGNSKKFCQIFILNWTDLKDLYLGRFAIKFDEIFLKILIKICVSKLASTSDKMKPNMTKFSYFFVNLSLQPRLTDKNAHRHSNKL
jgi:hypothetical protein